MKMPPTASWQPQHRHDGRFWETSELLELLMARFGVAKAIYRKSREYRVLIATIRDRNNTNMHRKGYALDWKGLRWENPLKQDRLIKDKQAFSIKVDVLEYLEHGRIPASVLPYACEHLCEAEVRVWADDIVMSRQKHLRLVEAAE